MAFPAERAFALPGKACVCSCTQRAWNPLFLIYNLLEPKSMINGAKLVLAFQYPPPTLAESCWLCQVIAEFQV